MTGQAYCRRDETEIRAALRSWIIEKNGRITASELADDTPILERRIVTSLQTLDLILLIERLSGTPIDASLIKPGSFRSIDAIVERFFGGAARG